MDENLLKQLKPILYTGKILGFVYFSWQEENRWMRLLDFLLPAPFLFLYVFSCYKGVPMIWELNVENKILNITQIVNALISIVVVTTSTLYFMINRNKHKKIVWDILKLRFEMGVTKRKKPWKVHWNYVICELFLITVVDKWQETMKMPNYCYAVLCSAGYLTLIQKAYENQINVELYELIKISNKEIEAIKNACHLETIKLILKQRRDACRIANEVNENFGFVTTVSLCLFLANNTTMIHYFLKCLRNGSSRNHFVFFVWGIYMFEKLAFYINTWTSLENEVSFFLLDLAILFSFCRKILARHCT